MGGRFWIQPDPPFALHTLENYEILTHSAGENTKVKCASLLFLGGKWEVLRRTLLLMGSGFARLDALCEAQVHRWIFSYNRSYAPPSDQDRQEIAALLRQKAYCLPPEIVRQILFLSR